MKRTFEIFAAGLAVFFAASSLVCAQTPTPSPSPTLFGSTFVGSELISVNPSTGAGASVGAFGKTAFAYGIGTKSGRLYTFDQTDNRIKEINKVSGKFIRTIDIGVSGLQGEGDVTFRADGMGFLVSNLNGTAQPVNDFYTFTILDTGNLGFSARLGSTGVAIDALAFDSAGTLYAIGQNDPTLYTVNTTTGATSAVGALGVNMNSPIAGMAFAPDGRLFAAIDDRLHLVNKATGAATPVSSTVLNFSPLLTSVSGLTFAPGAGTVGNMAARVAVGVDDRVGIGGFIIRGTPPKPVVLRGIGPSLNVPGALADPVIELFNAQGVSLGRNDNFRDAPASEVAQLQTAGLVPDKDAEAALVRTLPDGNYTVVLSGANRTSGIGLAEIYDNDRGSGSRLANISSRGFVGTGNNILIGGIIMTGSASQRVVVRAIGPDLKVPNPLQDPFLDLRNANGVSIGTNNDFASGGQTAELTTNSLTPGDPRDSAIIADFAPGNYTALVSGVGGSTGLALVEFFNLSTNNQ